jgi:hypothetical protein
MASGSFADPVGPLPDRDLAVCVSFGVLENGMGTSSTLARAVAVDRNPAPLFLAKPVAWALVVACCLAAIEGALALHAAEGSFSPFGLESFGLGTVAKASIHSYGIRIAAGVLLALAAGLMHLRRASFASPKSSWSLALRITGLLPVFAAATTVSLLASAVLLSDERSSVTEFIGSADLVAVAVTLPFRMALLGSLVVISSPLLRKKGGIAMLVGKVMLVWFVQGCLWVVLEWFLHEIIPRLGVSPY